MNYESKAWAETKGACLRNFNEQGDIDSVNGALALRPKIEKIVDQIWEEGFDNIYFIGIGGTYASAMQVEVYMRGKSSLPVYVENAAEYLTTGNKRLTDRSVVIYSTVSGNTKEMVQLIDTVKARGVRVFAFIDTPRLHPDPGGQVGLSGALPQERTAEILHGRQLPDVQERRIPRL